MTGHKNWSKIKRTKGALDVKRGRNFSRLSKEITVATRLGGGNSASHPRRRATASLARAESMPTYIPMVPPEAAIAPAPTRTHAKIL